MRVRFPLPVLFSLVRRHHKSALRISHPIVRASNPLQLACPMPRRRFCSVRSQYHVELADMMLSMSQVIEQEISPLDRVPWNWAGRCQIVFREFCQDGLCAYARPGGTQAAWTLSRDRLTARMVRKNSAPQQGSRNFLDEMRPEKSLLHAHGGKNRERKSYGRPDARMLLRLTLLSKPGLDSSPSFHAASAPSHRTVEPECYEGCSSESFNPKI